MKHEDTQDDTQAVQAWSDRGREVAGKLDKIAQHAEDLIRMEADRQYLLEDMTARLFTLAARLRGDLEPKYRYAYPMEGEN